MTIQLDKSDLAQHV